MGYILVTNDDGVQAPGVRALFGAVGSLGEAVMVAPERDNSAVSHSLTLNRPLRLGRLEDNIHTVDGTPTDCVTLGLNKVLPEKPLLLVSGINAGANLGDDISYSGTVSAAIEGTMYGVPSLSISLAGEAPFDFTVAAAVAWKIASMALLFGLPASTLLNINVPQLPAADIRGFRYTRQGRRVYRDAIQETRDPWGRKYYWIGGGTVQWDEGEDTDEQAVRAGYISITPIQLDLTNHAGLDFLQQTWKM